MKKTLLWLLVGPLALLLTLAVAVNVIAWGGAADSPPDPATVIRLPDGAQRSLGELIEAWSGTPVAPALAADDSPGSRRPAPRAAAQSPRAASSAARAGSLAAI